MEVKVNKNSNTVTIAIIVAGKHLQIETRISKAAPCLPHQHRPVLPCHQGWGDAGSPQHREADGCAALSSGSLPGGLLCIPCWGIFSWLPAELV